MLDLPLPLACGGAAVSAIALVLIAVRRRRGHRDVPILLAVVLVGGVVALGVAAWLLRAANGTSA